MGKLIAIGEALIDFMPRETGVPLADVCVFEKAPGGAPANAAACAARLGARSMLITQLGDDGFGDYLVKTLRGAGVDVSAVLRTDKAPTGLAFVSLHADGEREFLFYRTPSADMLLEPESVGSLWFKKGDILHFCSVALNSEPMRRSHRQAVEHARNHDMLISFDVNLRFPLWPDKEELRRTIFDFIPGVQLLKTGCEELMFLTGLGHDESIASMLERVPALLVTYGKNGAALNMRDRCVFHPGYGTPAVDTTGAGDAFIGSFLASLLETDAEAIQSIDDKSIYAILERAHAVASLVVSKKGAINAMPDSAEVRHFMDTNDVRR